MNIEVFGLRLVQNKPVRVDQLIVFHNAGHFKVRPREFEDFIVAQKRAIAAEKQKRKEAKQK